MFSKITIASIGKTQKEYVEIESHYLKQLKTKVTLSISQPLSHLTPNEQIQKESAQLTKTLPEAAFIIALDSTGTQFSSEDFAKKLDQISQNSKSIAFIIGGSHGLSDELKQSANLILSFSKFTLPHQMAKAILLEQIYRAETIFAGSKYHK